MKNPILVAAGLFLLPLLCARAASPEDVRGEPVLPADALATVLNPLSPLPTLEGGLEKLSGIRWEAPAPLEEAAFAAGPACPAATGSGPVSLPPDPADSAPYSASLVTEPQTKAAVAGATPRDCDDVYRERRQVRRWIARTDELRREIDERLKRLEWVCRVNPRCDTASELDGPLTELNQLIVQLRAYAEREQAAPADRFLVYRFRLDEEPGLALLDGGWRPVGVGAVERVRYYQSPWECGVDLAFGNEGKLQGAPRSRLDGTWIVERRLTATHACVDGQVFRLEFHADLELYPQGSGPKASPEGIAQAGGGTATKHLFVRAISL